MQSNQMSFSSTSVGFVLFKSLGCLLCCVLERNFEGMITLFIMDMKLYLFNCEFYIYAKGAASAEADHQ